MTGKKGKAIGK